MNRTEIEWVKNPDGSQGYTWNPITGCLNGCSYCYARKLANGRLKQRYLANKNVIPLPNGYGKEFSLSYEDLARFSIDPFFPRFWEERLDDIKRAPLPWFHRGEDLCKGIFVCDMGELFGDWIPSEWQEQIFRVIKLNSQHRFYLLTKQPQNLAKWSPFPDNCWVGVTATDVPMVINACKYLGGIEAKLKFLSIEPLLDWETYGVDTLLQNLLRVANVGWLIIGLQTPYSPKTAPKAEWIAEIVDAADRAGIPVFLKDNLNYQGFPLDSPLLDANYYLRQELPR